MSRPLPVILCGGLGTRLGPLAADLPKPMVQVGGRPFLEHLLLQLRDQGFEEVLLLTGFRGDVIRAHFGTGEPLGLRLGYSQEPTPLGTGGALKWASNQIGTRFLLLYGDLYRPMDYAAFADRQQGNCLGVYPYVEGIHTIACGNVNVDREAGQVTRYLKDCPEAQLAYVDAGFGLFNPSLLDRLPAGACSFEHELYDALARERQLACELVDRTFFDIGNPEDLARTRAAFLSA